MVSRVTLRYSLCTEKVAIAALEKSSGILKNFIEAIQGPINNLPGLLNLIHRPIFFAVEIKSKFCTK